jgi:hypothetical protein
MALAQASTIPLRTLDKGFESQLDDGRQAVAKSAEEWSRLWNQHAGERPRPNVDFSREMVVGVFLGSRPTAGFAIELVGAREEAGVLVVRYRETRPAAGGVTAQVLTSPYHIVAVPRHADVRFERVD